MTTATTTTRTTIADKLARVKAIGKAAGFKADTCRHLIHGCGGSPRRAKRAIRYGWAEFLSDAYAAAFADTNSHAKATAMCNDLWQQLAEGEFDGVEPSEAAEALQAATETETETETEPSGEAAAPAVSAHQVKVNTKFLRKYRATAKLPVTDAKLAEIAAAAVNLKAAIELIDAAAKANLQ